MMTVELPASDLKFGEDDLFWRKPKIIAKADSLRTEDVLEPFQLKTRKDLAELGKTEFGRLVRSVIFNNLGLYDRLGPSKFVLTFKFVTFKFSIKK